MSLMLLLICCVSVFGGSLASNVTVDSRAVGNATYQLPFEHAQLRNKRAALNEVYKRRLMALVETFEFGREVINPRCFANLRYSNDFLKFEDTKFIDCLVKCHSHERCVAMTHYQKSCFLFEQKVEVRDDVNARWKSCWLK